MPERAVAQVEMTAAGQRPAIAGLYWTVLTGSAGLLFWGLRGQPGMFRGLWTQTGLRELLTAALVFGVAALILGRYRPTAGPPALLVLLALWAVAAVGVGPLAAVVLILISALLLGDAILGRTVAGPARDVGQTLLALLVGLAIWTTGIGLLVHFPVNSAGLYFFLLSLPLLVSWRALGDHYRTVVAELRVLAEAGSTATTWLPLLGFALWLALVNSLAPEIGHDALASHLLVPAYVAAHAQWTFDVTRFSWAVMPMGGDWLYTLGFMLSGEYAAQLLNYAAYSVVILLVYVIAQPIAGTRAALVCAALFASTPLLHLETGSLFIENLWTAFLLGSVLAALRLVETGRRQYLYAAALLLGAGMATKLFTIFFAPIVVAAILYSVSRRALQRPLPHLAGAAATAAVVGAIPYVYAAVTTGNPVFPFMNHLFRSPYFEAVAFNNPLFNQPLSFDTLYDITFRSHKYLESTDGAAGFQYLALLPMSLIVLHRSHPIAVRLALIGALAYIAAVFQVQSYLRYLYPALALLMLPFAVVIARVRVLSPRLHRLLMTLCIVIAIMNLYFTPASGWYHRDFSAIGVLKPEWRERFVRDHAPERRLIDYLNARYGHDASVGFLSRPYMAGLQGEAISNSWHSPAFSQRLAVVRDPDAVVGIAKDYGLTHLIVLEPNAGGQPLAPAVAEFLERHTTAEYRYGLATLRRVDDRVWFAQELLVNPGLNGSLDGWQKNGVPRRAPDGTGVVVSISETLMQGVTVSDRARYRYTITARCDRTDARVRVQVNWHNAAGRFIGTTLLPKPCAPQFVTFVEEMRPPRGAVGAVIYVGGHGPDPVTVREVSFAS